MSSIIVQFSIIFAAIIIFIATWVLRKRLIEKRNKERELCSKPSLQTPNQQLEGGN